jgi:hypothetical protein
MTSSRLIRLLVIPALAVVTMTMAAQPRTVNSPATLPFSSSLSFVPNRGQISDDRGVKRPDILYTASSPGMQVFFAGRDISYVFARRDEPQMANASAASAVGGASGSVQLYRIDLHFEGARPGATLAPAEPTGDYSNYYLSGCQAGITRVPGFRQLLYREVWPGIDIRVQRGEHALKYDFIVHPGGNVADIRLRYRGADSVVVDEDGSVRVSTPFGNLSESAPVAYQDGNPRRTGRRSPGRVASSFTLRDGELGFSVGAYDHSTTLVIDPTLEWATYYGGINGGTAGTSLGVDRWGNVIMGGYTNSYEFPDTLAFQTTLAGSQDAFLVKFDSYGQRLWATFYGGNDQDLLYDIALDMSGNIVATGLTDSHDFPVTSGAFQQSFSKLNDAWLAKFDSNGLQLWSTYFGGLGTDFANGVAVDGSGRIGLLGRTDSGNLPTTSGAFQKVFAGSRDIFVATFTPGGALIWSTYYGGSDNDGWEDDFSAGKVSFDLRGNLLATGTTLSTDFPVLVDARQPTLIGKSAAFAIKFDRQGKRIWATFIGGTLPDPERPSQTEGMGIVADSGGNVYVTGTTDDNSFPTTTNAYQTKRQGATDGFLMKLDSNGRRIWATYAGGTLEEYFNSIILDAYGNIVLAGTTSSPEFPISPSGAFVQREQGFIIGFDSSGIRTMGIAFGGTYAEKANDIGADTSGALFLAGTTYSFNLPTTPNAFQRTLAGDYDAFIAKFGCSFPPEILTPRQLTLCLGDTILVGVATPALHVRWSTGDTVPTIQVYKPGTYDYLWYDGSGCVARSGPIVVSPATPPSIASSKLTLGCDPDSLVLAVVGTYSNYLWSTGEKSSSIVVRGAGIYTVTVTDANGCKAQGEFHVAYGTMRPPAITPAGPITLCTGESITLDAGAGYLRYRWSTGDTVRAIRVGAAGSYSVTVTDSNNCTASAEPATVSYYPSIVPIVTSLANDTLVSTLAKSYQWSRDGNPIAGADRDTLVADSSGLYTVAITDSNGCHATSAPFEVLKAAATISIGSYQWAPGERITIPLEMTASRNLRSQGVESFTAKLRFNKSLLLPADRSIPAAISGNDRTLTLTGTLPSLSATGGGTLAQLGFNVLLGDATSTPISIEDFAWNKGNVRIDTSAGLFTLNGLCLQGVTRLLSASGQAGLKPVRPNPASHHAEIEYEVVEQGRTELYLVDLLGRITPLLDIEATPGHYVATADLSYLGSGTYTCVLQTPTERFTGMLRIER